MVKVSERIVSKKSLAVYLSKLIVPQTYDPSLEQYVTDSEVAASLLWNAYLSGDVEGKVILDAGCGCGILGIGALLLGADHVTFVDVDEKMIKVCGENLIKLSDEFIGVKDKYTLIENDIKFVEDNFDTIIMNPPFGVQKKYADRAFLEKGFQISSVIYSIHDASTIDFLTKFAEDNHKSFKELEVLNMHLRKTMTFHKKEKHTVRVALLKFYQ